MFRFRKKPIVIEAVQLIPENFVELCGMDRSDGSILVQFSKDREQIVGMLIDTLEGTMQASPGDWLIRGVKGEVYPCKPDIFSMTYEPLVESEALSEHLTSYLPAAAPHVLSSLHSATAEDVEAVVDVLCTDPALQQRWAALIPEWQSLIADIGAKIQEKNAVDAVVKE